MDLISHLTVMRLQHCTLYVVVESLIIFFFSSLGHILNYMPIFTHLIILGEKHAF